MNQFNFLQTHNIINKIFPKDIMKLIQGYIDRTELVDYIILPNNHKNGFEMRIILIYNNVLTLKDIRRVCMNGRNTIINTTEDSQIKMSANFVIYRNGEHFKQIHSKVICDYLSISNKLLRKFLNPRKIGNEIKFDNLVCDVQTKYIEIGRLNKILKSRLNPTF